MVHFNLSGWDWMDDGFLPRFAFNEKVSFSGRTLYLSLLAWKVKPVTLEDKLVLPPHSFRVARTPSGGIVVIPGEDRTDRCLVFTGTTWRPRNVKVTPSAERLPVTLLKSGRAGDGGGYRLEIACLLEPGQGVPWRPLIWTGEKLEEIDY